MEACWMGNLDWMLIHLVLACEDLVPILQNDNIHLAAAAVHLCFGLSS